MQTAGIEAISNEADITHLPFTDLYLCLDTGAGLIARFRPDPVRTNKTGHYAVPPRFFRDIDEIRTIILQNETEEGTITYKGLRLRYARFTAAENEEWAAVRAVPLDLPELDELGMNPKLVMKLRGWGNKKGCIIVGGKTGEGKTTTSIALLNDYLRRNGGLLFTCEDPIEFLAQGAISDKGFCLQYEVKEDTDWTPAIKRAMRTRPDYIFVGEIRTAEAAEQFLQASTSGHLVVTTVHAGSVSDAVNAIVQMAERKMGRSARSILADSLIGALFQKLTPDGPIVKCVEKKNDGIDNLAQIIKSGDISSIERSSENYPPSRRS